MRAHWGSGDGAMFIIIYSAKKMKMISLLHRTATHGIMGRDNQPKIGSHGGEEDGEDGEDKGGVVGCIVDDCLTICSHGAQRHGRNMTIAASKTAEEHDHVI